MHNRRAGIPAVVLLVSTLAAACSSTTPPAPQAGTATLIAVPAASAPAATGPGTTTGTAPAVTAPSALPDAASSTPGGASTTPSDSPSGSAGTSPTSTATSTGTATGASSPAAGGTSSTTPSVPGNRQDLLAASAPAALGTLVTSLNSVSDKLSDTVSENGDAIDREYTPSWTAARAAGLTVTAVLGPDDLAAGMKPETPTSAYLVDVSRGTDRWCLIDVNLMPDGSRTTEEETKRAANFFPYYAAHQGSCSQQPFLAEYFK